MKKINFTNSESIVDRVYYYALKAKAITGRLLIPGWHRKLLVAAGMLGIPFLAYTQSNTFPSTGNVGLGTLTPSYVLDVYGTGAFRAANGIVLKGSTGSPSYLSVDQTANSGGKKWRVGHTGSATGFGSFDIFNETDNLPCLSISSAGNIGVGTVNPSYLLDVNGSVHTAGQSNFGGGAFYVSFDQTFVTTASYTFRDAVGINNPNGNSFAVASSVMSVGNMSNGVSIITTGNVGIGTSLATERLSVNGNVRAKKVIVTQSGWSDYVFDKAYRIRSIASLERYIQQNRHLPDMPSAKDVEEKGISVGDNQALLLKKIEELTLYVIELKNENRTQNSRIHKLEKEIRDSKK